MDWGLKEEVGIGTHDDVSSDDIYNFSYYIQYFKVTILHYYIQYSRNKLPH